MGDEERWIKVGQGTTIPKVSMEPSGAEVNPSRDLRCRDSCQRMYRRQHGCRPINYRCNTAITRWVVLLLAHTGYRISSHLAWCVARLFEIHHMFGPR